MKLSIQSLLLIMTFAATIFSCKDDDDEDNKLSNAYVYNGKTKAIKSAVFEDNTDDDGGGYSFWFAATEYNEDSDWGEYVWIDIPKEMMGAKFDLTEEQLYDWAWWIEYRDDEAELYYEGFGGENQMEDVKSGTMTAINKGDGKFAVEADIVFNDGKILKLSYSGKMVDWADGNAPSRKATLLGKSNSPNK